MEYKILIDNFEGPLDLLLHLIKEDNLKIEDIDIEVITKQYLDYINAMQSLDLNIASEYLVMAAELIELKSRLLLPNEKLETTDEIEDPRESLINRLLEYNRYKQVIPQFKDLEIERKTYYTKDPSYEETKLDLGDITLNDLSEALTNFLIRKEEEKPLNTKITTKEYNLQKRSQEIKALLKTKKRLPFTSLFEVRTKDYIIVTFLAILEMAKKHDLKIIQANNFDDIYLMEAGSK